MTILDTPSAAVGLDVERFPTAVLPRATTPFAGNELVAILQGGRNVYAGVTDLGGGTGGVRSAGVSTGGNILGITGLITAGALVLAGLGLVTLSQSTDPGGATVSISAPTQSVQTQDRFDLTISGNTAGVGQLVSSGTLSLAGGPNVTLSQVGNAITISAAAGGGANFSAGVSNLGNFGGSTGMTGTRLVLVGTNNITLSQSTDANGGTVSISGNAEPIGGVLNIGNTGGTTGFVNPFKQYLFVGSNNITLSQSIAGFSGTVSIFGQPSFSAGASNLGNTAGATGVTGTRLVFVGSNNITLSQTTDANGGTLSIFGPSPSGGAFSAGVSTDGNTAGATGITGTQLVFVGLNAVSLSQTTDAGGGTISIRAPVGLIAGMSTEGNTAGTTGYASVRLLLVGGANITLSQSTNAGSNTITIIGPAPSGGAFSAGVSNLGNTAGSTGLSGTQLVLVGTNGISLSQSTGANGATVSINFTQSAESNTLGMSNLGNTSGTSGVISGNQLRLLFAGGNNITLSQSINGSSATITISAFNQSVQTQNLIDMTLAGNSTSAGAGFILMSSGTVTLAGGNNITLSQNGNAVTISAASQSAESQSIGASNLGNTLGTSGVASGAQVRAIIIGTSNLTVSQSVNGASATLSLIANAPFVAGVSNLGNTAGATGVSSTQLVLVGSDNITLSQTTGAAGATVSIFGPSPSGGGFSAGASNLGNTGGSTGVTGTRLVLAASGEASLFQSTDANGGTVTINVQRFMGVSNIGNTLGTTGLFGQGQIVFSGNSNITLSQSTGAGSSVTIGIIGQPSFSAGMSTQGNTAGNTGVTGTRLVFVGTGGISLSQTTDANGGTLSINFTQSAESQSIGASNLGNTLGTSGVASGPQVRAIIVGTSNITISQSVNGASATLSLIGNPSFSAGLSNLGNTAGATGISGTRLVLVGTNNITLSQTTDANGATISISGAGGGAGAFSAGVSNLGNSAGATGITGTRLVLVGSSGITLSQTTDANGGTVSILAPNFSAGVSNLGNTAGNTGVTGSRLVLVGTDTVELSQATDANGATISIGETLTNSVWVPWFAGKGLDVGTLSNATAHFAPVKVDRYYSGSAVAFAYTMSANSTGTITATLSQAVGIYTKNGSTLSALSISGQTYGVSYTSTQSTASYNGGRMVTMSFNLNLTPGEYWIGIWYRTSGANISFTNVLAGLPVTPFPGVFGLFGGASVTSAQAALGFGALTATSTTLNSSVAFSHIQATNASQQRIEYLQFYNVTA